MNSFSWKNLMKEIAVWIVFLTPIVLALFILVFLPSNRNSSHAPNNTGNSGVNGVNSSNPQISSSFSVAPKTSPDDSDLVIEHHYKATIDGEVVNVPIHTVSNPVPVPNPDNPSSLGNTVSYKQELDLTPLLSDYEHKTNWEVGAGVGCHDGDVYFPVSVQRNLSHDRAVEGVVHLSDSGSVNGGEVLFKKRF